MTWAEFWGIVCNAVGSSGCGSLDYSLAEMKHMIDGKERAAWRHTLLNYSCSSNPNSKALSSLYPYYDECRNSTSKEAHNASVSHLRDIIKSRF